MMTELSDAELDQAVAAGGSSGGGFGGSGGGSGAGGSTNRAGIAGWQPPQSNTAGSDWPPPPNRR